MKKITLILVALLTILLPGFSQVNTILEAPMDVTTTQVRVPNGTNTHVYHRACALVLASELTNMPIGTTISSFGYTMTAGTSVPVAGNFTVYLQNTSDISYLKGTSWPAAIAGMTVAYANVMTIPMSTGTNSILLTLSTPVTYTGGGLYVATDWNSPGPYSSTIATYLCDNGAFLNPGCASAASTGAPAPTTLGTTNFRPSFLFGFANPNSNDLNVIGIEAPGKVAFTFNTPHNIVGVIRNTSNITKSNITVSLTVTGANPFTNTQSVPSLAAGAYTSVTFSSYNPLIPGANTISVSVAPDQNNANNAATYAQSVTCSTWAQNPAVGTYTAGVGFQPTVGGIILGKMINPVSSTLTGMNFGIAQNPASVGNAGSGVLMSAGGVILATTNTITITSPMLGTSQYLSFSPPVVLAASTTYYLGAAQPISATQFFPAGGYVVPYVMPNLYFSTGLTGGAFTAIPQMFGYFNIEAIFAPPLSISSSPSITCSGSAATIAVIGPTSYTWSAGSTPVGANQNLVTSPLFTTVYSVVGSNTLGCNYNGVYTQSVNPLPNVSIASNTNAICIGSSVFFTAMGAVNYSLNNVATAPTITQTPLSNTGYTIIGMDANGCVNTASIGISVFSVSSTVSSNTAVCKGKSTTISATGVAQYSYYWLGLGIPNSSALVTPTATTVYTVVATDLNGCSQTNTVSVDVNPNPTVTATASRSIICKGESVTFTGVGAATYTWNNVTPGPAITLSPPTSTTYVIMGATSAGCTHSITFLQVVNPCTELEEGKTTDSRVTIFPNPNNGIFNVSFENPKQIMIIEIYNTLGSLVKRQELNGENATIDLGNESNGIYIMQVRMNNEEGQSLHHVKTKIVKQ